MAEVGAIVIRRQMEQTEFGGWVRGPSQGLISDSDSDLEGPDGSKDGALVGRERGPDGRLRRDGSRSEVIKVRE